MANKKLSGLDAIIVRNALYFRNYRSLMVINIMLFMTICSLSGLLLYQYKTKSTPYYFPTTVLGLPIDMPSLEQSHVTDETVRAWVQSASSILYSFDFVNYQRALQDLRPLFTARGHSQYMRAIQESNNLKSVKKFKQVVTSFPTGDAVITWQGVRRQRYRWHVKIPLAIVYQNSTGVLNKSIVEATIKVIRVSTLEAENGLAITQVLWW